jgi:hypothetical protein
MVKGSDEVINTIRQMLERCVEELRRGELTEQSLRRAIEFIDSTPQRQDLLYLQASGTSLTSEVVGMLLVQNGEVSDGPPDPKDWQYRTVLDAIRDGWRIIQFPNLALMMDESRTYGLGCEFILEKLR